jgi:hypothetical protein
MVLGWPLPNLCPVIPTSNQDGRQDKIEKGGMQFFTEKPEIYVKLLLAM